jgi:hypothetical protein
METCSVCAADEKEVPVNWTGTGMTHESSELSTAAPRATISATASGTESGTAADTIEDNLADGWISSSFEEYEAGPATETAGEENRNKDEEYQNCKEGFTKCNSRDTYEKPKSPSMSDITDSPGSSVLDGNSRVRSQQWRYGSLMHKHDVGAGPHMTDSHIANAVTEDLAHNVDYDSYHSHAASAAASSATAAFHSHPAWTDMVEDDCPVESLTGDNPATYGTAHIVHKMEDTVPVCGEDKAGKTASPSAIAAARLAAKSRGVYVNLLDNPESYTGYTGESPRRVWKAIHEENCFSDGGYFGALTDNASGQCLEKRVFYRLISGMQASISTHIAKDYYFEGTEKWGTNIPLFVRAVGSHPERINNLYFTFLFVLRAISKAAPSLTNYRYDTGHKEEDEEVASLMRKLVTSTSMIPDLESFSSAQQSLLTDSAISGSSNSTLTSGTNKSGNGNDVQECREGFDEDRLFQVPDRDMQVDAYNSAVAENVNLRNTFRSRFQNITRIMDCVTCDKCRVWGKLQILGIGASIKVLLTPDEDIVDMAAIAAEGGSSNSSSNLLTRQEVIAMVNTLHQLAQSVLFSSKASEVELDSKIARVQDGFTYATVGLTVFMLPLALVYRLLLRLRKRSSMPDEKSDE